MACRPGRALPRLADLCPTRATQKPNRRTRRPRGHAQRKSGDTPTRARKQRRRAELERLPRPARGRGTAARHPGTRGHPTRGGARALPLGTPANREGRAAVGAVGTYSIRLRINGIRVHDRFCAPHAPRGHPLPQVLPRSQPLPTPRHPAAGDDLTDIEASPQGRRPRREEYSRLGRPGVVIAATSSVGQRPCPRCGTESQGAAWCAACGLNLRLHSVPEPATPPVAAAPVAVCRRRRVVSASAGLVLVLLAV